MNILEFFQKSEGSWKSIRTTHHLAFKKAESGESVICVKTLSPDDTQVLATCKIHNFDPKLSIGGAYVSWTGGMAWDKEDVKHDGSTAFAIIQDAEQPQRGKILRDRGYADAAPVVSSYQLSEEDVLTLTTNYGGMDSTEQFWFAAPNVRLRTSIVSISGGITTATFCSEIRIINTNDSEVVSIKQEKKRAKISEVKL